MSKSVRTVAVYVGVFIGVFALVFGLDKVAVWQQARAARPTLAIADTTEKESSGMADWLVTGAGSLEYNGEYTASGSHMGEVYYTHGSGVDLRYLYWNPGGQWHLAHELAEPAGGAYQGAPGELPGNPWIVVLGVPPAPTVTAVAPPPGPIHIRDCPRDVSEARIEWVDNGGDKLLMLGVEAATTRLCLDIYDPATGNWTEGADPPDALRDAGEFDTAVHTNRLYVVALDPPGDADGTYWYYNPATDTWTGGFVSWSYPVAYGCGPPVRLVAANDGNLYVVHGRGGYDPGSVVVLRRFIPVPISESLIDETLDLGSSEHGPLDLFALSGDTHFRLITSDRKMYVWDGSDWVEQDVTGIWAQEAGEDLPHNWSHGAVVSGIDCYYAFREAPESLGWRFESAYDAIGSTSYDINGVLDVAMRDTTIYLLVRHYPSEDDAAALYRAHPQPEAPPVTVTVAGANITVAWTFTDEDRPTDNQSAYRVVITDDDGGAIHDTTKTVGTGTSFAHGPLADGGYIATVTLWDSDDLASAEGSDTFIVGGPGPDNPPTANITAPNDGDTLLADTDITVAATDDTGVVSVQVLVDGTSLGTLTAPNDGVDYTLAWEVAGWANGQHTITAIATDTVGQTGSDTITITLNAAGDVEDPVVNILAPADAAVVGLDVPIIASATDNVAVVRVRFYIDNQLQETLTAPNYLGNYRHIWDSNGWANGSHTITVRAWDASGNFGDDSVTVTLDVTLANTTKYFFTKQLPTAAVADDWRLPALSPQLAIETFVTGAVPAELHRRYQVTVGVHVPGDSVDFDDYQIVTPDISHGFTVSGSSLRWALRAQPTLLESYWEIAADEALCLVAMPTGYPSVVVDGAAGLWHFDGADLLLWEALDLVTPRDATFWNGKIAIVGDNRFILKDADTDELTYPIALPDATDYRAVAGSAEYLYLAIDTALSHFLYRFSYDALTQAAVLAASANVLTETSEVVGIGDADGKVSQYTPSGGLVELYDTGEAGVHSFANVGTTTYAGTGNAGKVFRSAPDWTLDTTLAGTVTCFASWQDYLFAATDQDGKLWRRTEAGWTNWHTLAGVVAINDMLALGDELWLAVEHITGARVYRIQAAETGHFACGPEPPDMVLKLLKTV